MVDRATRLKPDHVYDEEVGFVVEAKFIEVARVCEIGDSMSLGTKNYSVGLCGVVVSQRGVKRDIADAVAPAFFEDLNAVEEGAQIV